MLTANPCSAAGRMRLGVEGVERLCQKVVDIEKHPWNEGCDVPMSILNVIILDCYIYIYIYAGRPDHYVFSRE